MTGVLLLVIGPRGAGKDTLLDGARRALAGDARFRFVRRAVDQPREKRTESHEPLEPAEFASRRAAGAFAFAWRTGGVNYGVPADIVLDLDQGRVAVVNLSRALVADAASRFPVRVIEIAVPPDLLARRLAAMGQGDAVDAARRLSRRYPMPPDVPVEVVANDGTIEQGVRRLTACLIRAAEAASTA